MSAKTFLVLLGVLILAFFAATGWGLLSGGAPGGSASAVLVELVAFLKDDAPLRPGDVTRATPTACRQQLQRGRFEISSGRSCTFAIEEGDAPVRTLPLRLLQGQEVELRLRPGDGSPISRPMRNRSGEREIELQVPPSESELTIACRIGAAPGNRCVLDVP